MADILELTAVAMEKRGYTVTRHDTRVAHRDSGFIIEPVFFDSTTSTSSLRANTGTSISHPDLIPHGVFEYQRSFGASLDDAISQGIDQAACSRRTTTTAGHTPIAASTDKTGTSASGHS
ncbi:MAG TPA: hypothetical protein VKX28_10855 [Xanthobacteraceae bacterium]|nr:hypothetical protein [Xanthobacteraceae bacterium]